jgi:hypothetical protein
VNGCRLGAADSADASAWEVVATVQQLQECHPRLVFERRPRVVPGSGVTNSVRSRTPFLLRFVWSCRRWRPTKRGTIPSPGLGRRRPNES